MITLSDLDKARALLKITNLSRALGWERTTLDNRIRRGAPEITEDEAEQIRQALEREGITKLTGEQA